MDKITVDKYVVENALDGLRIAANILNSRKRETAADRQIEYGERLLRWILEGQIEDKRPKWIP